MSCRMCEGGCRALLFLSDMVGEDPSGDKSSVLPRGEPDWPRLGGASDVWRLEKVSGDSDGTLERVDSPGVAGEGLGVWQSASSDSRDSDNLPKGENKRPPGQCDHHITTSTQPITTLAATNMSTKAYSWLKPHATPQP